MRAMTPSPRMIRVSRLILFFRCVPSKLNTFHLIEPATLKAVSMAAVKYHTMKTLLCGLLF